MAERCWKYMSIDQAVHIGITAVTKETRRAVWAGSRGQG
jgi:hypothetical protein